MKKKGKFGVSNGKKDNKYNLDICMKNFILCTSFCKHINQLLFAYLEMFFAKILLENKCALVFVI